MKLAVLFGLFVQLAAVDGLKFLVYNSRFSRSHVLFMGKLADALAAAGHDVVNFQPVMTSNFNETGVRLARTIERELTFHNEFDEDFMFEFIWSNETLADMWKAFRYGASHFGGMFARCCRDHLQDRKMIERLKAEKFDLAALEYFDPCSLGILEAIGLKKYIAVYSMPLSAFAATLVGLPASHSFVPDLHTSFTPQMSFFERLKNVFTDFFISRVMFMKALVKKIEAMIHEEMNPHFDFIERAGEASFVFVNADELLDYPRPLASKIVNIGGLGISQKHVEPLPPAIEKIFKEAKRGVVFFSLGTVAPSSKMPDQVKIIILEAFSEFQNVTFLWKYEEDDGIARNYSNVVVGKWWPQKNILTHDRLLLFLSHAGANSVMEGAYAGCPLLLLPLFADQRRNARMIEWKGQGLVLDKTKLSKEYLVEHLRRIIEDESFRTKAKEMARMLADKPQSADEKVVAHAVFAAKYDAHTHLDMREARHMNPLQYHNVDVLAFLIAAASLILYVFYRLLRLACSCCCGRKTKPKTE